MASLLCICDQGYRASIEEQDDTVVWMAHMLQRSDDTKTALLLRGSAVNYAHKSQEQAAVQFGEWKQAQPANFPRDLANYLSDGGTVYVLEEDAQRHGIASDDLIADVKPVKRADVSKLVAEHDLLSFW